MIVKHCELCGTRMVKPSEDELPIDDELGHTYEFCCPHCGLLDNRKPPVEHVSRSLQMTNFGIEKYRQKVGQRYINE